jgi:hypothetical protein
VEDLNPGFLQAFLNQTAAFLQLVVEGGRGPESGQPMGPGGTNHGPEVPREWVPPPAPGHTLRQRVEAKERKAGLRCDDPSCGIGPSDEDPFPVVFDTPDSSSTKRVAIRRGGGDGAACGHVFHPACLVSADRCSGWGAEDRPCDDEYKVVSCSVCRSVGKVEKEVWEEGATELCI